MRTSMKFKDTKLTKTIANRTLALLLSACMIGTSFGSVPLTAYASSGTGESCEHHTSHTAECGYSEATQGHECTHVHDGSCGYSEGSVCTHTHTTEECGENEAACTHAHNEDCGYQEASSCNHTHDDACGYSEATSGSPCTYTCTKCNGSVSRTSGSAAEGEDGNDNEPKVTEGENTTDDTENDADAEDTDAEDTDADDSGATCTCTEACTEESFNTECPICKVGGRLSENQDKSLLKLGLIHSYL